ncbi:MAG: hypothetical protein Q9M37_09605 [Desulfonauticus sp.]|nr:hypothetical protein [Desulfonauticus sp.]
MRKRAFCGKYFMVRSISAIAKQAGIPYNTIFRWKTQHFVLSQVP